MHNGLKHNLAVFSYLDARVPSSFHGAWKSKGSEHASTNSVQIIVGIQSVSKTVKQHQMMTLALQTSFHDVKSIVKLKGDYSLILSLRLPTKLTWLSAYGGPKQTLFFYRLMGAMVGPQRGAEDKVRERKREEKSRLRKLMAGGLLEGGWVGNCHQETLVSPEWGVLSN